VEAAAAAVAAKLLIFPLQHVSESGEGERDFCVVPSMQFQF